jgi:hypothetical protein
MIPHTLIVILSTPAGQCPGIAGSGLDWLPVSHVTIELIYGNPEYKLDMAAAHWMMR